MLRPTGTTRLPIELAEHRRQRGQASIDLEPVAVAAPIHRLDALELRKRFTIEIFARFELDELHEAERVDQRAGRPERDDLAAIHDRDAVAERRRFFHVMRGDEHGAAPFAEMLDDLPQRLSRARIEARGGLVEKEELRITDQRAREGDALALAAGELAEVLLPLFAELNELDELVHAATLRVEGAKQEQHLLDHELVGELRILELDPDARAELAVAPFAPGDAEEFEGPAVGVIQSFDELDGGRLAGAVRAQQAEALAATNFEVDAGYCELCAVAFDERTAANRGWRISGDAHASSEL